jgi:ATP:corrinoid adenosyltransferase
MERNRFEVLDAAREYVKKHTDWKEMENSVGIPQSLGNATRETWIVERPGREEMFKAGVEWADAHQRWISAKERLPEDRVEVLVYDEDDGILIASHYEDYWEGADEYANYNKVTHWMPMPAIPKGGEEC